MNVIRSFLLVSWLLALPVFLAGMEQEENRGLKRKQEEQSESLFAQGLQMQQPQEQKKIKLSPSLKNVLELINKKQNNSTEKLEGERPIPVRRSLYPNLFAFMDKAQGRSHIKNEQCTQNDLIFTSLNKHINDSFKPYSLGDSKLNQTVKKSVDAPCQEGFNNLKQYIVQAAHTGDLKTLKFWLAKKRKNTKSLVDTFDYTLAEICAITACQNNHLHILQFLKDECGFYVRGAPTLLAEAVKYNNIDIVRWLIKEEAGLIRYLDASPLYIAAEQGNLHIVQVLVEAGADEELFLRKYSGFSPFGIALKNNHLYIVDYFIHFFEDHRNAPEVKNFLLEAVTLNNLPIVKELIERGWDATYEDEQLFKNPLCMAAKLNNLEMVAYLLKAGAPLNKAIEQNDRTPIHLACINGSLEMTTLLLSYDKSDLDIKDEPADVTPIYYAVNNVNLIKYLLQQGSSLYEKDDNNQPQPISDWDGVNMLHEAAKIGNLEVVKYLIEEHNYPILRATNSRNGTNKTAWQIAYENGHQHILDYIRQKTINDAKEKVCMICCNDELKPDQLIVPCYGCLNALVCDKCITQLARCPQCKRDFPK